MQIKHHACCSGFLFLFFAHLIYEDNVPLATRDYSFVAVGRLVSSVSQATNKLNWAKPINLTCRPLTS
jgi:hypothetical protein